MVNLELYASGLMTGIVMVYGITFFRWLMFFFLQSVGKILIEQETEHSFTIAPVFHRDGVRMMDVSV